MVFRTFFNLSLNLVISSSRSEPQSLPGLVFADSSPTLAAVVKIDCSLGVEGNLIS